MTVPTTGQGRSGGTGPVPPPAIDLEAERAVLGGLLLSGDPRRISNLLRKGLSPGCFWYDRHRAVFAAMIKISERREGIDTLTVRVEMEHLGTSDECSPEEIEELMAGVPTGGNIIPYATRVLDQARWRKRRRVAWDMLEASEKRDDVAWAAARQNFVPPEPSSNDAGPTTLRLVNEHGEVVEEQQQKCPDCRELEDQLAGAQTEIRRLRRDKAELTRNKDEEARKDALWLPAQLLFKEWQKATNRPRTKWGTDRFYACEPFLRRDGPEAIERAIAGIAYDPWKKQRRNGTWRIFNEWESLFKDSRAFDNYLKSAPLDWKPSGKFSSAEEKTKTKTEPPRLGVTSAAS